ARSRRSRGGTPLILRGSITFSSTVALGIMKNCWKTKPYASLRSWLVWVVVSARESWPSTSTVPLVGLSRRARQVHERRLARAALADDGDRFAAADLAGDAAQRVEARLARAVALDEVAR